MDHPAQGSAPRPRSLQGPDHLPKHARHDAPRSYLPALADHSDPTHPHPPNHHHLAPPHPAHDGTHDGFRTNSGDDDVDALINSALAAYAAGAARNHSADQLALVRAAANAIGHKQQRQDERQHGHTARQHGPSGASAGDDDHQGLFLPQLPVPPPSFANVHPAPAPAALPSPPPTSASSAVAAASILASSSSSSTAIAAAPPARAAPLPSSTSSAPSSAPAPPAPGPSRGRGPGSRARWSAPEDAHLVHLVRVVPPLTWNEIGAEMGRAPTGCSMRWYKFLRERVARGEMGPNAAPAGAAGGAQGLGALEPSSEMIVGGSAGATMQAQAHGGAVDAVEGSLQVVDSSGTASSTSPSAASLAHGTAKARPLRKPTPSALATGRPAAHVAPIEPSALPPPLPPSETLPGHPYPLKEGTKLHSNAGKGYLPRDAMVAKPPVPFQPHTVLRGRRTQKAVPLPLPDAATATATGSAAEGAPDSASPADFALPLPPHLGAAASATSPSSTPSAAPSLQLGVDPSASATADPTAASSAPAPTSLSPSLTPAAPAAPVPAPGAPLKKGKGSKGGLSKAQASVHACPAEHCTAAFKRSEHLRRHYKSVHRGEKPFPCTVAGCGKTFSRKDNLQQHQAMVHLVRARYTYPDGSSSNDPPEAGTDAARLVVISFDEVDVTRSAKAGASASGADQEDGPAAGAGAKAKRKRQKKGERTPAVVAQAQAQGQAQAPPPTQGADAQAWRAVVPGAAQYSVAPSTSPSVEPGEGDNAQRPLSSAAKRPRERSAGSTSASGSRLDGDDAHVQDDGRIDKRLRLTGLAGQDDDALDPVLQVLAAQAQAHAHAHAHAPGHRRGARSITPSAAFALSGTHELAHAPILGSTSSGSSSAAADSAADAAQEFYARIAQQLQGGRRSGGGDGRADMLVHSGVGEASTGAGARAGEAGGLAGLYVPGLEAFLDGQLGAAQGLGGEAGGQGGGQ